MTITTPSEFLTALLAYRKAQQEVQKNVSSLLAALIEFAAAHPDTIVTLCGSLVDFISSLVASSSPGTTAEDLAAKLDAAVAASQALETATT